MHVSDDKEKWLTSGKCVIFWEGYFGNVIGSRLQVTLFKMQ